ncbi:TMM54 protein, partial [Centropus unirufus]|nr:TMM54 protein [Centropus unirufus]
MRTGLLLLIIRHLSFVTGARIHRTVLDPRDATALQLGIANAASVVVALLTISCGIAALMLSRYPVPAALVSTRSP